MPVHNKKYSLKRECLFIFESGLKRHKRWNIGMLEYWKPLSFHYSIIPCYYIKMTFYTALIFETEI